jgi:raffinose/stachyose/melibiose transport system substrate-binding protein
VGITASATAASAPQTLTLTSINTYEPGFAQVIKDFQAANPSITINASYEAPSTQYSTQIGTEFAAGSGDDLVYLLPGNGNIDAVWPFALKGYLLNLSNQPWVKSLYKPVASLYKYKGKTYAWDFGSSTSSSISYNETYFAQHHLKVPATFSQLLTLCKTIAKLNEIPISWGGGSGPVDINNLESMAEDTVFANDPSWLKQRAANKTTFVKTAGWRQALNQILQMQTAGCFQPGVAGLSLPAMVSQFGSGQAAMMFTYGGLNALASQADPSLKAGIFPPPGVTPATTRVDLAPAGGLGIWDKSPHIAADEAFVKFLAQPAEMQKFTTLNDLISPQEETTGKIPPAYSTLAPFFKAHKTRPTAIWQWPNISMETLAGEQVMGLFTNQLTVTQILQDLDNDWKGTTG